jgi:hypothetical protein
MLMCCRTNAYLTHKWGRIQFALRSSPDLGTRYPHALFAHLHLTFDHVLNQPAALPSKSASRLITYYRQLDTQRDRTRWVTQSNL